MHVQPVSRFQLLTKSLSLKTVNKLLIGLTFGFSDVVAICYYLLLTIAYNLLLLI